MVRGLAKFREHFAAYTEQYILIGGAACSLAMEDAGLEFRATRDLDIVLVLEALDTEFAKVFWGFIEEGGYDHRQKSTGKDVFYRFHSPSDAEYPVMLELFSRKPDAFNLAPESHLTPIPIDEEIASLSAILLDEAYYLFIREGKREIGDLALIGAEHLIPMKARAWLDLHARRASSGGVDSRVIVKHKNDVFRLYQLLSAETRVALPDSVRADMLEFCDQVESDGNVDLSRLGLRNTNIAEVLANIREIYGLN